SVTACPTPPRWARAARCHPVATGACRRTLRSRPGSRRRRRSPPRRRPRTGPSAAAEDDQAVGRVVGRDRDCHPIAGDEGDVVAAQAPADLGEELHPVVALDPVVSARERLGDGALDLDEIVPRHSYPPWTRMRTTRENTRQREALSKRA